MPDMLALRILNGPQAGQVHQLRAGSFLVGRGTSCQIQLQGNGVSKEHLEIRVAGEQVSFRDLKSANGTYLNGVRVPSAPLKLGDKVLIGPVLCDVVLVQRRPHNPHGLMAPARLNPPAHGAAM
ncbi:MAG: hypothetical protein C5B49_04405, partial [Bdellovibrio sp.]